MELMNGAAPPQTPTLDEITEELGSLRKQLAEVSELDKMLKSRKAELERSFLAWADANGVEKATSNGLTMSVTSRQTAQIQDMEGYMQWCLDHGFANAMARKANPSVLFKLAAAGTPLPAAVELGEIPTVSIRKVAG
ncbi:MAG: hypothetical protein AB8G96_13525 [Phycisphaerales bacterium]